MNRNSAIELMMFFLFENCEEAIQKTIFRDEKKFG